MQKYIKNYLKHHNIWEQDFIACWVCWKESVDLHHIIFKSQWWTDDVDNLIPLCREDHNKAHYKQKPYLTAKELQECINII